MASLEQVGGVEQVRDMELSVQELSLDLESNRVLRDALLDNNVPFGSGSEEEIVKAGSELRNSIPSSLEMALVGMAAIKSRQAALLVRGLPIERPVGNIKNGSESEILLAAIGSFLGKPFVAKGHREGRHILNLIPKQADAAKELATGTELQWHSEDAQLADTPRFICLLGLRGNRNAQTLVSTAQVNALNPDLVTLLSRPLYTFLSDESYSWAHQETAPVLSPDDRDQYRLRYDVKFTQCDSQEGLGAYRELERIFERQSKAFVVDTGDLLIFNNKITAHKRSMFTPSYNEEDRWLQRLMVV